MSQKETTRRFRFSYRLRIMEDGERNGAEFSVPLKEGIPCSIEEVERSMKDAVERIVDAVRDSPSTKNAEAP